MKIFEGLIKILPELKNINFKNINHIHFGINIGSRTTVINQTIKVDYSTLSEKDKKLVKLPTYVKAGVDIL